MNQTTAGVKHMKNTKRLLRVWQEGMAELLQVKVLVNHFLKRFVQKDNLDLDDKNTEFLVFGVVFVSLWGGYLANKTGTLFFISIMMTATAIFCLLNWERLLLDQRDFLNLSSLPVRGRTLFAAKILSLVVIVGIITTAFGLIATLVYFKVMNDLLSASAAWTFGWSFFVVCFLANLFVFLLIIAVQSLFMLLLRGEMWARVSVWVQVVLLMGLGSVFIWLPRLYETDHTLQSVSEFFSYLFPPLWFHGLHQWMNGTAGGLNGYYIHVSWLSLVVLGLLYVLSLPLSLKQFFKQQNNRSRSSLRIFAVPLKWGKHLFDTLLLRNLTERAVFYFFTRSIKRSRFHRLKLALFLALPVGLVLTYLITQYNDFGAIAFRRVSAYQMAFPFIIYFATLLGLRTVVDHPVALEANWLFQVTAATESKYHVRGMKKAMFVSTLLPIALCLFCFYLYAWGLELAVKHSLYSVVTALLMQELFFFNYRKIPFTAVHNPTVIDFKVAWPIFVLKFLFGYSIYIHVGNLLLNSPKVTGLFYLLASCFFVAFGYFRNKISRKGLIFKDVPPSPMVSLDLYY